MPNTALAFLLLLAAASALRADVTIRYSMTVEPGSAMPQQAAEQMKTQMKEMLGETSYQIKGNRARSSGMGMVTVTDFDGASITLIDDKKKRYASASQRQYLQALKDRAPKTAADQEKALAGLQMETSAKKTDRTRDIHGMQADETEVVLTMQMPNTPFRFRAAMSLWFPAASETARQPAVAELATYAKRAWEGTSTAAMFQSFLGQMPGAGEGMSKLMDALKETGLLLEMNATMSMPGFREAMSKVSPQTASAFPGSDDVVMTMTQNLTEISTAELPESLFAVPKGYTAVGLGELISQIMPARQPGRK